MRSVNRVGTQPASLPLAADDIIEFHAARLLLLMEICGAKGRINGLTKMAKLDFFARYPDFFDVARIEVEAASNNDSASDVPNGDAVESAMVRHHYGPWDKRYYHVLAYLEGRGLITVHKSGNAFQIGLTALGHDRAKVLEKNESFLSLVTRMKQIKKTFGGKTGTFLKNLIYRLFDKEVAQRAMGKEIVT